MLSMSECVSIPGISDEGEDAIVEEHDGKNQQPVAERQELYILHPLQRTHTSPTELPITVVTSQNREKQDSSEVHMYSYWNQAIEQGSATHHFA